MNPITEKNVKLSNFGCSPDTYLYKIVDFRQGNKCGNNPEIADVDIHDLGIVKQILMDQNAIETAKDREIDSYDAFTAGSFCSATTGSAKRIFASYKPNSPIIISNKTKGLTATFQITNKGIIVNGDGLTDGVASFVGGPFSLSFDSF